MYMLRFEILACEDYTIYINPLLDTINGYFKWGQEFTLMLLKNMIAFEEIGSRNLALPLKYAFMMHFSVLDPLLLDMVSVLTLVMDDSTKPY